MFILTDFNKLIMYNVIPEASSKKYIEKDKLKELHINQNAILKNV